MLGESLVGRGPAEEPNTELRWLRLIGTIFEYYEGENYWITWWLWSYSRLLMKGLGLD